MPRIAQGDHVGGPISHDLHPNEVVDLTPVAHFERHRNRVLDHLDTVEALYSHNEIFHVNEDVEKPVDRVSLGVEARVLLRPDGSDGVELFDNLDAPQSSRLFGPIESQDETADIMSLCGLGSDREHDVHLLVHLFVEVGRLHINVVLFPDLGRRHR